MKKTFRILLSLIIPILGCVTNPEILLEDNPYISFHRIETRDGRTLEFALILPEVLKEDQSYPVLIAFPSGEQTRLLVEAGLEMYWVEASIRRNWIVVSPVAPDNSSFYYGAETMIPDLMNWIEARYLVEGGKFHIAGASAGGISSFRIAVEYPDRCMSVMAMPGYPVAGDFNLLERLADIPVAMFVGYFDADFMTEMDRTYERLDSLGVQVTYNVRPTDGHVISSVSSDGWFNVLDEFRPEQ